MRLLTAWLLLILFLVGCQSMSNNGTQKFGTMNAVFEQTACEAMDPLGCSGEFGFKIDAGGNFTAGPSPTGKTVTGQITMSELNSLMSASNGMIDSTSSLAGCSAQPAVPGVGDVIRVTTTAPVTITTLDEGAFVGPSEQCPAGASTQQINALNAFVHQLRQKYYPNPFPQ